jgi:hypothetical protein
VTSTDQRVFRLEQKLRDALRELAKALADIAALKQRQYTLGPGGGPGGGGGTGAFVSTPSGSVSAGGSLAAQTVKSVSGGVETSLPGTFTLYNQMGSAAVASKKCNLIPDGAGGYVIYSQSCA